MLLGVNFPQPAFNASPSGQDTAGTFDTNYTYPTHEEIDYFASKGMDVIRLGFAAENVQPNTNGPLDSAELARMDDIVSYAASKGVNVVLDMHNYGSIHTMQVGTSDAANAAFANVWGQVASHFAGDSNVIFGLMNEPNQQSASQWITGANAAIAAIRQAGATQEVLVPGSYWDGAATWTTTDNASVVGTQVKDPLHNYAFEVHNYLDSDGSGTHANVVSESIGVDRMTAITQWAEATGNKLFLGEFGVASDSTSLTAMDNMLTYMQQHTDVWQGGTYWAAGPWFGNYMFSAEPTNGTDQPQMAILDQFTNSATHTASGTGGTQTTDPTTTGTTPVSSGGTSASDGTHTTSDGGATMPGNGGGTTTASGGGTTTDSHGGGTTTPSDGGGTTTASGSGTATDSHGDGTTTASGGGTTTDSHGGGTTTPSEGGGGTTTASGSGTTTDSHGGGTTTPSDGGGTTAVSDGGTTTDGHGGGTTTATDGGATMPGNGGGTTTASGGDTTTVNDGGTTTASDGGTTSNGGGTTTASDGGTTTATDGGTTTNGGGTTTASDGGTTTTSDGGTTTTGDGGGTTTASNGHDAGGMGHGASSCGNHSQDNNSDHANQSHHDSSNGGGANMLQHIAELLHALQQNNTTAVNNAVTALGTDVHAASAVDSGSSADFGHQHFESFNHHQHFEHMWS
jgi:hypothetical protein